MTSEPMIFDVGGDTVVDSTTPTTDRTTDPYATLLKDRNEWLLGLGGWNHLIGGDSVVSGSAPLVVTAASDFDTTVTLDVIPLDEPWSTRVGWADKPAVWSGSPATWTGTLAAGETAPIDVSAFVSAIIAGHPAYGWRVRRRDTGTEGSFYKLGSAADTSGSSTPTLTSLTTDAPDAPDSVFPSGGRIVNEAKPFVGGAFGSIDVTAVQVQIKSSATSFNENTGFTSPAFNSGEQPATTCLLDLSGFSFVFTAPPFGAVYQTIRVKDINGRWSKYSPPVLVGGFMAPPVPVITSPTQTGDTNPPLAWTVTGTQVRSQVLVRDPLNPAKVYYDSGEVASAVTAHQPVVKPIIPGMRSTEVMLRYPGHELEYVVRTWDDKQREATPGAPSYGEARQTVKFTDDLTVNGAQNLRVDQVGASPWVDFKIQVKSKNDIEYIIPMLNGEHIGRFRADGPEVEWIDGDESGDLGIWRYWDARPWQERYVWGVKLVDFSGKTSDAIEFLMDDLPVYGFWAGDDDPGSETYKLVGYHSGVGTNWTRTDQIGIQSAYGAHFPMVQYVVGGYLEGDAKGEIRDAFGEFATTWEGALHGLSLTGRPLRIAYENVTGPGYIYDYAAQGIEGSGSPWEKSVSHKVVQADLFRFVDQISGLGDPVVITYDFEEGTNGADILKEDAGGSPGVIDKDGTPKYAAAAKKHGEMGADLGGSSNLTYAIEGTEASFAAYLRFYHDSLGDSDSARFFVINDVNGAALFVFKVKDSGKIVLDDIDGNSLAKGDGKAPFGATDADWIRVAGVLSWNGTTASVRWRDFLNGSESTNNTDELFASIPSATEPASFTIGNDNDKVEIHLDSVTIGDNASQFPPPLDPQEGGATHLFSLMGGTTATGVIVTSRLTPGADVGASVDLAISTDSLMAGATLVGVQVANGDALVKHTVSGLTPDTHYYARLVNPATGDYYGEPLSFKTYPTAGASWSEKWAVWSCLNNASGGSTPQLAMQDTLAWQPDRTIHLGDWGYWGGTIDQSDSYTKDLQKYDKAQANYPAKRAVLHSSTVDVVTISDHELHDNGDLWGGDGTKNGDTDGAHNCVHAIREQTAFEKLFPIRSLADGRNPRRHRGYSFDIGAKLRMIVVDLRSPDRSNADDADSADKQLWGAAQEAWLFSQFDATRLNLICCETSLWKTPAGGGMRATDKPAAYPTAVARMLDKIRGTGPYAGGPTFKVKWIGGDRHRTSFCAAADDSAIGIDQIIGSGLIKNALALQEGEHVTWSTWTPGNTDDKFSVCSYMQMTVAFNAGTGQFTITINGRYAPTWVTVTDGVTTKSSKHVTSATANFTAAITGMALAGPHIPAGAVIDQVVSSTEVVLSKSANANATGVHLQVSTDPATWAMQNVTGSPTVLTVTP